MFILPKGSLITDKTVEAAIKYNEELRPYYNKLENYYVGKHVILDRDERATAANNRVVVNHAKFITDINVGYLLGNPVSYNAEKGVDIDLILDEYDKQTISDLDHEIAKNISKFGKQYEWVYANEKNEVRSYDIDNRNCILVGDNSVEHKKLFAVIYEKEPNKEDRYISVKIVTDKFVFDFIDAKGKLLKSVPEATTLKLHGWTSVPVIEYKNNSEELGDYEIVLSLIDAYNTLASDRVNDKEQLVDAILAFIGMDVTEDQIQNLKVDKVITVTTPGGDVKYVTKQLNEADTDVLRKALETDIFKISMTPNMSDENFVGNSTGVAIAYKLLPFEQKILSKQRSFEKGLKERLALYNEYLTKLNKMRKIEVHKVDVVFKRNLPKNDLETSQMILNLTDMVDRKTLLTQLSFIRDVDEVMEAVDGEIEKQANAESKEFGTEEESKVDTE